ncbi:hypothetical protein SDC9_66601 [bioreactor metagenome]|uniref:Uncharacterized protein n=1 Tax=bioreactor metagenome TaxID=1076179 RepID=A0A644XVC5_9ZZZZ
MGSVRWRVNFWPNGEVVTDDGELIGTWDLDAEDHPSFTPIGAKEELFWNIGIPLLAWDVVKWLDGEDGDVVSR